MNICMYVYMWNLVNVMSVLFDGHNYKCIS